MMLQYHFFHSFAQFHAITRIYKTRLLFQDRYKFKELSLHRGPDRELSSLTTFDPQGYRRTDGPEWRFVFMFCIETHTCLPYLCLERSSPSIDHKHKDFQGPGSKHNLGIKLKVKF